MDETGNKRRQAMSSSFKSLYGRDKNTVKKKKVYFKVGLEIPEGVTIREMGDYILESVQSNVGCKDPSCDPLFYLDRETVKVTRLRKTKNKIAVSAESAPLLNWKNDES